MARDHVVGITESMLKSVNGRPSTQVDVFTTGTPYFTALPRLHKIQPYLSKPKIPQVLGSEIPK